MAAPIIGITAGRDDGRYRIGQGYVACIQRAGGHPVVLPASPGTEAAAITLCDAIVFSGGDDPVMEPWGMATHPAATPVDGDRQTFETTLLQLALDADRPTLGVCLGMQWMGLAAGGTLDQHLPDTLETAAVHADGDHPVEGVLGHAVVHSNHHQALAAAGSLEVIAVAEDGVIEAVRGAGRWWVGVQWHPERTGGGPLGQGLFDDLVAAAR